MIRRRDTNDRNARRSPAVLVALACLLLLAAVATHVHADGDETLGPPSIDIETGSVILAYGTETHVQPAYINFAVPDGATIKQVLAYWSGEANERTLPGDDTIRINEIVVTGTLIGGPAFFYHERPGPVSHASFRADITGLLDRYGFPVVDGGWNALTVEDMNFDPYNNGVGIVVIYDDGSPQAQIQIVDGIDLAYAGFPEPRQTTIPQTFHFEAANAARTALLGLLVGAIDVPVARDTTIEITIGDTVTRLEDVLDVPSWDSRLIAVELPAGSTSLTVQIVSGNENAAVYNPDAFAWIAAFLSIPGTPSATPDPEDDGEDDTEDDGEHDGAGRAEDDQENDSRFSNRFRTDRPEGDGLLRLGRAGRHG